MVTVEYEGRTGRRETGQLASGEFRTTVSKTIVGTMDEALDCWLAALPTGDAPAFDGVPFAAEPSVSRREKRYYLARVLAGGIKVTVFISAKPGGAEVGDVVATGGGDRQAREARPTSNAGRPIGRRIWRRSSVPRAPREARPC